MDKPTTFDEFKHDKNRHKHDYSHEAHAHCKAYDEYLKERFKDCKLWEATFTVEIQKVNGVITNVVTDMKVGDWIDGLRYINDKFTNKTKK